MTQQSPHSPSLINFRTDAGVAATLFSSGKISLGIPNFIINTSPLATFFLLGRAVNAKTKLHKFTINRLIYYYNFSIAFSAIKRKSVL
jgi:hypothetical protein